MLLRRSFSTSVEQRYFPLDALASVWFPALQCYTPCVLREYRSHPKRDIACSLCQLPGLTKDGDAPREEISSGSPMIGISSPLFVSFFLDKGEV
jgi:hypothetical protein